MNANEITPDQAIKDAGIEDLFELMDAIIPACCKHGCMVEPDGTCEHGCESVLLAMGMI